MLYLYIATARTVNCVWRSCLLTRTTFMVLMALRYLLFALWEYSLVFFLITFLHQSLSFLSFPYSTFLQNKPGNISDFFAVLRFTLLSACGNVWIWTTLTMSLCHSQVGLSGIRTGLLVVCDAADHDGNGPCPLMGMASPSCVVEFLRFFTYLSFSFSVMCWIIKIFLLLYSIKSNDSAHATLFWSMNS